MSLRPRTMSLAIHAASSFEKMLEGSGRFRMVRRLGQGGSGLVYRVYDRERDEDVALKALSVPSATAIYQLKREFRALADVTHPNLAVLHELFCVGEEWCFTMELVEGQDFFAYVSEEPADELSSTGARPICERGPTPATGFAAHELTRGKCDLARLRRSLEQLVEGVNALHASGHLHLDLKPANVLVRPDGRLTVLDFGLSRETDGGLTFSDAAVSGTPAYMAPEQVTSQRPTFATDWYAVGSMLYEALTGVQPYSGHAVHVLMTKVTHDPPSPESLVPGLPREWSELCMWLLRRNPQERPSYEDLQAWLGLPPVRTQKAAPQLSSAALFVGREQVLHRLTDAREAVFRGTPRALLVSGPSGLGKTTVVQEFVRRAGLRQRAFLLEGRCFERESVPYKALDSVIDALSRVLRALPPEQASAYAPVHADALVRVFPVLSRVPALAPRGRFQARMRDAQQERALAFQALKNLLARMSDDRPVVMFIDDLQWGDRDSALLVRELLTPPDPPRLLLLGTHRSGDESMSPFLSAFAGTSVDASVCAEVDRVVLEPLSKLEAEELVRAMLEQEGQDPTLTERIVAEAEGNPFFASELVRSAKGRAPEELARTLPSLDQVLLERVAALSAEEQALLEIVTVIGRPVDRALVLSVSGLGAAGNASFDALRSARLIHTRGASDAERVEPSHDRIREVVGNNVAPARRAILHALVAREIEARGQGDAELLMLHYTEAGDTAQAAHHAVRAAGAASESLAFDHAAKLLRRALTLLPERPPAELTALHADLGHALERAGRAAEASEAYLLAAEHAAPDAAKALRLLAAAQLLLGGRYRPGIALLRDTLPEFGIKLARDSRSALLSLLWSRMRLGLRGLDFVKRRENEVELALLKRIDASYAVASSLGAVDSLVAADVQTRGVLMSLTAGEPTRVLRALAYEAGFRCGQVGGQERTRAILERARLVASEIGTPEAQGMVDFSVGFYHHHGAGDLEPSRQCLTRAEQHLLGTRGLTGELAILRCSLVTALDFLGDTQALEQRVPGLMADAERNGYQLLYTSLACARLFWLARDAVPEFEQYLATSCAMWPADQFVMPHYWTMVAETHRDLYQGDGKACVARVNAMAPDLQRSYYLSIPTVRIEVLYPRARGALLMAMAGEDVRASLHKAEADARALVSTRRNYALALAKLVRASIARLGGRHDELPTLLRAAAESCAENKLALHAAAARRALGDVVGGDEGRVLRHMAEAAMRERGVRDVEKMCRALLPGF